MKTLIVYSKDFCPYCVKAKKYLEALAIPYVEKNVGLDQELREWLKSQGHRTVPQIYLGDKLFVAGGCDGLMKLTKDDILAKMAE
jgi:glutaredoxin 3